MKDSGPKREDFTATGVTALLKAAPQGDRMGDLIRLSLVTGCRVGELCLLPRASVSQDARSFRILDGKTDNAPRFVPIPEVAEALLRALLKASEGQERLVHKWPIRGSTGKPSSASQAFTRFRRKVLGAGTDDHLALHSFRHTWRTVAGGAGVRLEAIQQLGGWTRGRRSDSVYDHGLQEDHLRECQEQIAKELGRRGFLEAW